MYYRNIATLYVPLITKNRMPRRSVIILQGDLASLVVEPTPSVAVFQERLDGCVWHKSANTCTSTPTAYVLDPEPAKRRLWRPVTLGGEVITLNAPLSLCDACVSEDQNSWLLTGYNELPMCHILGELDDASGLCLALGHTIAPSVANKTGSGGLHFSVRALADVCGITLPKDLGPDILNIASCMFNPWMAFAANKGNIHSVDKFVLVYSTIQEHLSNTGTTKALCGPWAVLQRKERVYYIIGMLLGSNAGWVHETELTLQLKTAYGCDSVERCLRDELPKLPFNRYKGYYADTKVAQLDHKLSQKLNMILRNQIAVFACRQQPLFERVTRLFSECSPRRCTPNHAQLHSACLALSYSTPICVVDGAPGHGKTTTLACLATICRNCRSLGLGAGNIPLCVILGGSAVSAYTLENCIATMSHTKDFMMYAHTCAWFIQRSKNKPTSRLFDANTAKIFIIDDAHLLERDLFMELLIGITQTAKVYQIFCAGDSRATPISPGAVSPFPCLARTPQIPNISVTSANTLKYPCIDMPLLSTVSGCSDLDVVATLFTALQMHNMCCSMVHKQGLGCQTRGSHLRTRRGVFWFPECAANGNMLNSLITGWAVEVGKFVERTAIVCLNKFSELGYIKVNSVIQRAIHGDTDRFIELVCEDVSIRYYVGDPVMCYATFKHYQSCNGSTFVVIQAGRRGVVVAIDLHLRSIEIHFECANSVVMRASGFSLCVTEDPWTIICSACNPPTPLPRISCTAYNTAI